MDQNIDMTAEFYQEKPNNRKVARPSCVFMPKVWNKGILTGKTIIQGAPTCLDK